MPEESEGSKKPKRVTALAFYGYLDRYRAICEDVVANGYRGFVTEPARTAAAAAE